jgi:alpha-amylase
MGWMLPGVIGKNPSHSVTFLDNHDTNNFGTSDQIKMGYAYILTHPGTPCVFWNHWNDAGINSVIKTLNILRKNKGITSTASVYIEKYQSGLYAAYINNAIAVKLGTSSWSPSDTTYKLYTSGNNFAVWAI